MPKIPTLKVEILIPKDNDENFIGTAVSCNLTYEQMTLALATIFHHIGPEHLRPILEMASELTQEAEQPTFN